MLCAVLWIWIRDDKAKLDFAFKIPDQSTEVFVEMVNHGQTTYLGVVIGRFCIKKCENVYLK